MTKKRRMTGVATLVVMVLFGASWLRADEPDEVFRQLRNTMDAFKVCNSDVLKKWPDEATSDEALNQLATDLCEREEVRDKNIFTMRGKSNGENKIEGITISETDGDPSIGFDKKVRSFANHRAIFTTYQVYAIYTNGIWRIHIEKNEISVPSTIEESRLAF